MLGFAFGHYEREPCRGLNERLHFCCYQRDQQLPFNDQLSIVQSARLGLGLVVVAISEVRHELALGGTVIVLPPVGDIALAFTSPDTHWKAARPGPRSIVFVGKPR